MEHIIKNDWYDNAPSVRKVPVEREKTEIMENDILELKNQMKLLMKKISEMEEDNKFLKRKIYFDMVEKILNKKIM